MVLPKEIEDIIMDYKHQLEKTERFQKNLEIFKYITRCNKCELCYRDNPTLLIYYILKQKKENPKTDLSFYYCYYRSKIYCLI